MKIGTKILSFLIMLSILTSFLPVYAKETDDATREIPYTEASGIFAHNYESTVTAYDEQSATEAGIPQGYSGYVLRVQPDADSGYAGCELDFSDQNISIDDIQSITFRVLLPVGHSEMRLLGESAPTTWVMRVTPTKGAWCDITLDVDGTNFQSKQSMESLANAERNLGRMCLIGRMGTSSDASFYLDSVRIQYKAGASNDKTPPVITYNGATYFDAYEGEEFSIRGVSAFDEYDNEPSVITYEWSSGAINGAGRLQLGTHTCTVKATDRSGNFSTIKITVNVKVNQSVINLDSIPYTSYIEGVSVYDGTVENLSSDEAATIGVPSGYSGNVLKVSSSNPRFGMTFDPTSLKIPVGLIEYITFRVYMNVSTNALRINNKGAVNWTVLANLTAGTWSEYTVTADGAGFSNSNKITSLADENGNLGIFGIATKYEAKDYVFYIDSITIKLKDDDGVAPVIGYSGSTDILTSSGKVFDPGITVFDELEQREITPTYEWSDGALDNDGKMLQGNHTCKVSATDYYGNTSYLYFNVTVGPADVKAPEIQFFAGEIVVPVGTFYRMTPYAIDNYDDVDVEEIWSDGAIDPVGRLKEGVHTLTLISTDLSGNRSEWVVTVFVVSGDSTVGTLIECGK